MATLLHALARTAGNADSLHGSLDALLAAARHAVPSCLSATLTWAGQDAPVTLTATHLDPAARTIRSSLAVHLPQQAAPDQPGAHALLVLQASQPGAFHSLAAETPALLDMQPGRMILDQHLQTVYDDRAARDLAAALAAISVADQARGILLDRGLTGDDARRALQQLAETTSVTYTAAATAIITTTQNREDPKPT